MPTTLEPDLDFVRQIRAFGGDAVKNCYQCATCSTICKLSPEDSPFPRKEMIQSQWGLKEQLVRDGDIWLCHDCTDCSEQCPRGARPSDVMGALRQAAVAHYSGPRGFAELFQTPKGLSIILAIPAAIFLILAFIPWGFYHPPHDGLVFGHTWPHHVIMALFFGLSAFVGVVFLVGVVRMWKDLSARHPVPKGTSIVRAAIDTVVEIFSHRRFNRCASDKVRAWGHLLVLWGFVELAVISTIVGMLMMFGDKHMPMAQTDIWKILSNIGGVAMVVGIFMLLSSRLKRKENVSRGSWFDWSFLLLLVGVIVTGFLAQLFRELNVAVIALPIYFIHLIGVFYIIAYIPYSKLAHVVYRAVAMTHGRLTGRVPARDALEAA
jgi:quinone-modifying oxidoreductase subunit QmoC